MMSIREFIISVYRQLGLEIPNDWRNADDIAIARQVLDKLNGYLFQTYDEIGTTTHNGMDYKYFSEFHKFWEAHHKDIINAAVNNAKVALVAEALDAAKQTYGSEIFRVLLDTHGLPIEAIAQVRFFTANQDFRKPPEDQFSAYLDNDTQFDERNIAEDPVGFLNFMGIARLSQSDKRADYAKKTAEFLLEKQIKAYDIAERFGSDALRIREVLSTNVGMGYGNKKTDMFIRDMFVLGVWPDLTNMDKIDVASDRNTMKVALRTGILQTSMPLLSSFLDIFGYQYSYIDTKTAEAWREVWRAWQTHNEQNAPGAPCMLDYLIYRIGREYCKNNVVKKTCSQGHNIYNFGALLQKCRICHSDLVENARMLPCQCELENLPRHPDGSLKVKPEKLLYTFGGKCIFVNACNPTSVAFKQLSPPKAISILGQTGWTESYADRDEGGGGMMG